MQIVKYPSLYIYCHHCCTAVADIVNKSVTAIKISREPSPLFKRHFLIMYSILFDQDRLIKAKWDHTIELRLNTDAKDRLILKLNTHF